MSMGAALNIMTLCITSLSLLTIRITIKNAMHNLKTLSIKILSKLTISIMIKMRRST
jgi:hypothetical protein